MGVIGTDTHKLDAATRHKVKHFVKELERYRGRGTELVSVYAPAGYDLNVIINQLQQEQGTAENIKSKQTRTSVVDALERMIVHLRGVARTPPNGLAAFSGNVAEREGQSDIRVWSIEMPIPSTQRLYRCDKEFILDPLRAVVEAENTYGLVVLDRRDAMIGLLKGKTVVPLVQTHSEVPGKHKSGGQCLKPDTRVRKTDGTEKLLCDVQVGDNVLSMISMHEYGPGKVTDLWHVKKPSVLLIETKGGGRVVCSKDHRLYARMNGDLDWYTAEQLSVHDELSSPDYGHGETVLVPIDSIQHIGQEHDLIDISVSTGNFVANDLVVHNSAVRFERLREGATIEHFKKIAEYMKEQFLPMGNDLKGIILGGPGVTVNKFMGLDYLTGDVKKKILGTKDLSYTGEFGLQELLEKSDDLLAAEEVAEEKKIMQRFFYELSKDTGLAAYGKKDVLAYIGYGAVDTVLLSEDCDDATIEEFEKAAEKTGATITLISDQTREGVQLREMGKIAALLRYPMTSQ